MLGLGGEQITELNINSGASTWAHTNVFNGSGLLATYSPTGNSTGSTLSGSTVRTSTYFALNDWLGTKRAEVGANGCVSTYTSMPFGGGLAANGNCTDPTEHHFTGKERDNETGNDYFAARYYNSNMGRWMSPDWSAKLEPVPYAKLDDPQSLNLYAYVGNNSTTKLDPDGHLEAPWHFAITLAAGLLTGHGVIGSTKLAFQTAMVDFRHGSQDSDASHTNMHAMRGTKRDGTLQTREEARAGTHQTVDNAMQSGDTAVALHAVQDQPVPLHEGHTWTGIDGSFPAHALGDIMPSENTVIGALVNSVQVLKGQNPLPNSHVSPDSTVVSPAIPPIGANFNMSVLFLPH